MHKSAGSEVVRKLEAAGLGGKGVTADLLDSMDLIKHCREGNIDMNGEKKFIQRDVFEKWLKQALDAYDCQDNHLEGAQDEHE